MRRIAVLFLALVLVLGLLTACTSKKEQEQTKTEEEENYIPVEVQESVKRDLFNVVQLSGKVYPEKEVMVVPKMIGKVTSVSVKVGDRVDKGDILFTLDKEDIENQIEQTKAAYESAVANYQMTQEQIENAKENLERAKQLYEQGAISKADFEKSQLAASDTSLQVAKAGVSQAEAAYNQAKEALKNTTVEAPIRGIVSNVNVESGEMASNAQPAVTIVDMDRIYVQINVTENMINQIYEGQEVAVKIPSASDEEFAGKIDIISPAEDLQTQLYPVKIYIPNGDYLIKPGMFAQVQLKKDFREGVIAVRSEAVVEKDGEKVLYVVKDGKAVEKKVETGLDTGEYIEIISGLEEGEKVIIKGQHYVEDNSQVKVVRGE